MNRGSSAGVAAGSVSDEVSGDMPDVPAEVDDPSGARRDATAGTGGEVGVDDTGLDDAELQDAVENREVLLAETAALACDDGAPPTAATTELSDLVKLYWRLVPDE